jgi:hypothetical protein
MRFIVSQRDVHSAQDMQELGRYSVSPLLASLTCAAHMLNALHYHFPLPSCIFYIFYICWEPSVVEHILRFLFGRASIGNLYIKVTSSLLL